MQTNPQIDTTTNLQQFLDELKKKFEQNEQPNLQVTFQNGRDTEGIVTAVWLDRKGEKRIDFGQNYSVILNKQNEWVDVSTQVLVIEMVVPEF
ncbi:hypothetical protein KKA15_00040 [Patescibacteria group bacterium]|nr:hypothetical protein [Patescibacteria group bacterium]